VEKAGVLLFRWRHVVVGAQLAVAGFFLAGAWGVARQPHPIGGLTRVLRAPRIPGPVASAVMPVAGTDLPRAAMDAARVHPLVPSASLLERMNQDDFTLYIQQSRLVELAIRAARTYIERQVIPALDAADRKGRDR
jgi:hypothetical protein